MPGPVAVDAPRSPAMPVDGLPLPRRYWSIAAIWTAMAMAVLDGAIANIALPTITRELGTSATSAIWIINIYQIAIVMLLLPFAAAGEILGYRRVYLAGVTLFVLASLGCALAGSLDALVACRFVQGIGAAAVMAINGALLRQTVPARLLGRGISYNAIVVSITAAAGPSVAAAILAVGSWHWIFAVNVPIGLAALLIGATALPPDRPAGRAFDWPSALLNAAMFGALFLGATDLAEGRAGGSTIAAALVAAGAGFVLVRRLRRRDDPLIPFDLLRVGRLRNSYVASVSAFAGQMIGLVALPFYLQRHFDHVGIGLLVTTLPLGVLVGAFVAGRISDRRPAAPVGVVGLSLFALGDVLLPSTGGREAIPVILCLATTGLGFGLFQSPNNRVLIGEAPPRRSGAAAGMMALCRLMGQTLGALVVALTFRLLGTVSAVPFLLAGGLGLVGAVATALRPRVAARAAVSLR